MQRNDRILIISSSVNSLLSGAIKLTIGLVDLRMNKICARVR